MKLYHTIGQLFLFLTFACPALQAQQVQVTGSGFPSLPATSCTNTPIDINVQWSCSNTIFQGSSVNVSGSTITVDLDYNLGIFCLPAIVNRVENVNLGMLPAGSYTININGNLNGSTVSTGTNSLTVNSCCPATPGFTASNDTICVGDSIYFNNTSTGATSQSWYENSSLVGTSTNYGKSYNTAGTYAIKLVVSDGSCSDSLTKNILVSNPPSVNLGPDADVCPGDSLMLDAGTGRDSIVWSDMSTARSIHVGPGSYYVQVYENGCVNSDSITLGVHNVSPVDLGPDTVLCYGDSLVLDAFRPGADYMWHDGSTQSSFTVDTAGTYHVIVTDSNGCDAVDSVNISMDSCGTYLEEGISKLDISVYPNPFDEVLYLEFPARSDQDFALQIYDLNGRVLMQRELKAGQQRAHAIDLSDLLPGAYLLRLSGDGLQLSQRLLKK